MDHVNAFTVKNMDQPEITNLAEQFVVQYYSVMRFSPANLHRFYLDRSSMIFESYPIYGQQQIHEKFMQLDLQKARVAVLQLDALKASDSSVVIQVAGEMSLNNQDFRRFMQTFILCEQASRDLYVMNDIFRFQDKAFGDVEEKAHKEPVSKPIPVEAPVPHMIQPDINRNIKPTSNGIDHAAPSMENSPMKAEQITQEHSNLHSVNQMQSHTKQQVSQNHQVVRLVDQSPVSSTTESSQQPVTNEAKSWAQMASSNVKNSNYSRFPGPQESKPDAPSGNRNQEKFNQKSGIRNRQDRDSLNENRFMNAAGGDNKVNTGRSNDDRGGRRGFRGGGSSRGGRGAHDGGRRN